MPSLFRRQMSRPCGPPELFVVLAGLLLLPALGAGAQPLAVSDHLALSDGLASPAVTALLRDQQGFLWIGTIDGLSRYDGYETTVFRSTGDSTSLAGNYVNLHALREDAAGHLWIGTHNGLSRYDPRTDRFTTYRHVPADACSLRHDFITAVLPRRDGTLWVGTREGLQRFEATTPCFHRVPLPGDGLTTPSLFEDRRGVLWVGTVDGLLAYDPATDRARPFTPPVQEEAHAAETLAHAFIYAFAEDPAGNLWVGTYGQGLFMIDAARRRVRRFRHDPRDAGSLPDDRILALHAGPSGRIWVGTYEDGLASLAPATGRFTRYGARPDTPEGLASPQITSFVEGRAASLWVGTWRGVNRLASPSPFRRYTADSTGAGLLSHPEVSAVAQDPGGALWVGTTTGGLSRIDPESGQATHYRHDPQQAGSLSSDRVSALWVGPQGTVWAGTFSGLNRFDRQTQRFTHYRHDPGDPHSLASDRLYSVYGDHTGTLWIGTTTLGLDRLDPQAQRFTHYRHDGGDPYSLGNDQVWPVYEDATGALWVGTLDGGLNRFDRQTQRFTRYLHDAGDPHSLSHDRVTSITEDADGHLWVGTMRGLNRLDPRTDRFERFTTGDGLPHHTVACLLPEAGGALWISTLGGLARLDPERGQLTTFGPSDGLPDALYSFNACLKGRDGTFYFGSFDGLVYFRPEDVTLSGEPPPVVLTGFDLFNEPARLDTAITYARTITLDHNENFAGFRFAALDLAAPAATRYAYRLDGVDRDWVQAGARRYASYPNLAPGTYTFRVRARGSHGLWNEDGASVRLVIAPPFWQTWWFYVLAVLATAGLLTAAYQYRVHHLLQVERTRQRIADDLHDDIGSKMSSIAVFLDILSRKDHLQEQDRRQLRSHLNTARQLTRDLRDTIWLVDTENDRLDRLVERMRDAAQQILQEQAVRFQAPSSLPPLPLKMELRRNVFLIYKEALHNAVRHAEAARVAIQLDYADGRLTVHIEDDGKGFEVSTVQRGRGMKTLADRAEQLGAELTLRSTPGHGTTVQLTVEIA